MPVRERLHDRLDMVAVFEPVSPALLAALPRALTDLVSTPQGAALRRRHRATRAWGRFGWGDLDALREAALASVVQHPAGLTPARLGLRSHQHGYPGIPITAHVSGSLLAVMFPHDLFDGSSAWAHLERLFQHAAGTRPGELLPPLHRPVLSSVRDAGLLHRSALAAVREVRREAESSTRTPPLTDHDVLPDDGRRLDGLRQVWLDDSRLGRLATAPASSADSAPTALDASHRARRTTTTMRLSSLVIDAARKIFPCDKDVRVRMAIDLRRYAPRERRIEGPFSTSYPLGTLRTIDSDPGSLGRATAAAIASKAPLAGFAADMAGWARTRVRHPRGVPAPQPGRRDFDLVVSTLPTRLPEEFWATDGERLTAAILYHPAQPTDPYVQVAHVRGGVVVSLWDEAGVTDRDAFAGAFTGLLDERYPLA